MEVSIRIISYCLFDAIVDIFVMNEFKKHSKFIWELIKMLVETITFLILIILLQIGENDVCKPSVKGMTKL